MNMRKTYAALFCASALLFAASPVSDACTNVIVTKGASTDGSSMVTYSADSHVMFGELYFRPAGVFPEGAMRDVYEWDSGRFMGRIPQVRRTYQRVGNMNEHQVIFTETTFGGREELPNKNGIMDYGSVIFTTLERAATAREAIKIMDELVQKYGYPSEGESFSISDPNESWIVEIVGKGEELGAVWVAVRIPDGYISGHANQSRINQFLKEFPKEDVLYSPDVISFARKMGWYEGADEDFSFCDTYNPADFGGLRGCEARVWSAFNILGGGKFNKPDGTSAPADDWLDFAMGYNSSHKMPLYIRPDAKVSPKALMDVMRDHYEGTPMDMTLDVGAGEHKAPYRWRPMSFEVDGQKYVCERAIATQQTGYWMLGQSRSWLPDEIGGILWFGVDDASTSCLTPIYTNITREPECFREGNGSLLEYSSTAAFWEFNRVAQFAYLLYDRVEPEVRSHADRRENAAIAAVDSVDKAAKALLDKGQTKKALACITDYSVNSAQDMFKEWQELDLHLFMKYKDGNIMHENEDGTFKNNGNSVRIPEMPSQPQHPEHWLRAIVKSNGEVLKVPQGK